MVFSKFVTFPRLERRKHPERAMNLNPHLTIGEVGFKLTFPMNDHLVIGHNGLSENHHCQAGDSALDCTEDHQWIEERLPRNHSNQ